LILNGEDVEGGGILFRHSPGNTVRHFVRSILYNLSVKHDPGNDFIRYQETTCGLLLTSPCRCTKYSKRKCYAEISI